MSLQREICPSNGVLKNQPETFGTQIFDHNLAVQSNLSHTLAYLRNFLEKKGYLDYIKHPLQIAIDSARKPNLDNLHGEKHDLPKIFQSVWMTNPKAPSSIKLEQLENFFIQSKKLDGYEKIIWTNIDPVKFRELHQNTLNNHDVTIKNIADLKTNHIELLTLLISPEIYIPTAILNKGLFNGVLIDLAKYLVMEVQGGILADFNFYFSGDFNKDSIDAYDFIARREGFTFIENGFFVAKAKHIIFTEVLDIIHDLLIDTSDCGINEYRNLLFNSDARYGDYFVYRYTMEPLFMAYLKYNNFANNVDTLMGMLTNPLGIDFSAVLKNMPKAEEYIAHEASAHKLDSNNFEDLNAYSESYYKLLKSMGPLSRAYDNMIDGKLIGEDAHSYSWFEANIAGTSI